MLTVLQKWFIALLYAIIFVFTSLLYINSYNNLQHRAIMGMSISLILVWTLLCGYLMYKYKDTIKNKILSIPLNWKVKFVLFATALALLEEVIAVTITNLASLFGVKVGEAYITASTNYFDVVFFHSVIVFIPFFIALAFLLSRYTFSPFATFIFFGILGIIIETIYSGNISMLLVGFQWIPIYGLMIYLPVYTLPENRGARNPVWWHHLIAIPYLFLLALPLLIPIILFITQIAQHPNIHF